MDNHISDIYIRSFRGISNLELKDIKLINILTGDNNGGKTSVLEVIQSIKNPFDLFIRDEADNCWIGVLLPEMAGSYLWDINMCQKKEYLPKDYKEEIIISIYRKFWNLLEKEEIEHCYFISNCLVSGISDYRLAIYYTAMYAYTLAKQMAAIQRRCKKIESRLSLNQPLVVDETGTLLDIYVYQSYQLENIEIKEFRDGLTLMEHMVLKYLLQERDIENSIGYGYRMRKIIEHAKISLRQKAVEYYGWSYIRSMFA